MLGDMHRRLPASLCSAHQRRSAFVLVLQLLCATACAHGVKVHSKVGAVNGVIDAQLVLVAPVELRWSEPSALLSYVRTLDVEEALCASGQLETFGPGELPTQLGAPESPSENDVSRTALRTGVPVAQILFLRASAERREQRSSIHLKDAGGRAAGNALDALVTLVAHVELSQPATHLVIADVTVEAELDPTIDRPLLDAQPELGPLLQRAVAEALSTASSKLALPAPIELGLRTLAAPGPGLSYSSGPRRSFAESLGHEDALEQEVSRQAALELFTQRASPQSGAGRVRADRPGLLVLDVHGRARASGLLPGDRIVSIDGAPSSHPCAAVRATLLTRKHARIVVDRGGQQLTLSL
jgi:hypothetical protein